MIRTNENESLTKHNINSRQYTKNLPKAQIPDAIRNNEQ